jgi:hypothetical protein
MRVHTCGGRHRSAAALGEIAAVYSCCAARRVVGVHCSQHNHYVMRHYRSQGHSVYSRFARFCIQLESRWLSFHNMSVLMPSHEKQQQQ